MRLILIACAERPFSEVSTAERIHIVSKMTAPGKKTTFVDRYLDSFSVSASEFFALIAERIKHLETYIPTDRDFAIEELQNAFVGLSSRDHRATKGETIKMAEARLRERKKKAEFSKSSWSEMLKEAFSGDELLPGSAGRPPSKAKLDENLKAERECKAMLTKTVRENGGNWVECMNRMKAARGSRTEYRRSEEDRLRDGDFNPAEDF